MEIEEHGTIDKYEIQQMSIRKSTWLDKKTTIYNLLARCVGVDKWTKIFILAFRPEVTSLRDLLSSHTG